MTKGGIIDDKDHVEALTTMIKAGVARIVDGLAAHDDDVAPVIFMVIKNDPEDDTPFRVEASPIPPGFLQNGAAKDIFAEQVIPEAGRVFRPVAMAMVNAAWAISYEGEAARAYPGMTPEEFCEAVSEQYGSLGASPYAYEMVSAVVVTRTEEVSLTARIHRAPDGSSATMDEWCEAESHGGRFPEALRKAVSFDN